MSNFDYDKIKDMKYDPDRGCYVGKNGEEFHVTPYSNGIGYKYDYYDRSPYGNASHNSTHGKSDLNENWDRVDNDRYKNSVLALEEQFAKPLLEQKLVKVLKMIRG